MAKVAVILSGSGHLDGAEIRESVISLVALDKAGAEVSIFAPDIAQKDVVNHLTGEAVSEERNVLIEAARIARGQIKDIKQAKADDFDALILPGGFGAAKNLSDLAEKGADATVLPEFKQLILDFINQDKPIGAICISPAILTAALRDENREAHVTIGGDEQNGGLIESLGGVHQTCPTRGIVIDDTNHIVSTPAYMCDAPLAEVAIGIEKLVEVVLNQVDAQKHAA